MSEVQDQETTRSLVFNLAKPLTRLAVGMGEMAILGYGGYQSLMTLVDPGSYNSHAVHALAAIGAVTMIDELILEKNN